MYNNIVVKTKGRFIKDNGTRRIFLTDELREELAQAAVATSEAYAVGSRNLSTTASSIASTGGVYIFTILYCVKFSIY